MDIINSFIKLLGINFSICYSFFKITNHTKISTFQILSLLILNILLSLLQSISPLSFVLELTFVILLYSLIMKKITNITFMNSILVTIISTTISFIASMLSSLIMFPIFSKLTGLYYTNTIIVFSSTFVNFILVYLLFQFKRFKNGFPIFQKKFDNLYLNVLLLIINTIIIFSYLIIGSFANIPIKIWILGFIILAIIMLMMVQKTFIIYQKQKLQTKTLKEYEQELEDTKQKLSTALEEKQKLIKSNHEFYHRQEALNKKLDDLINLQKQSFSTEYGEDYGELLDRINNLSDEYNSKIKATPSLVKTNITEIDDMLSYMQSECSKSNIELIIKTDCNIQYILDNFISKSQLETLLGDLIRNAIIAINHSSNDYKSIMLVFGIKDDSYELCIFDSGVPFNIDTLLNFGLKPSSTHEDEGGTGIGLITTYETINSCNASLIINEITNSNYTKSLEIKFDNKNEYIIISDRIEDINKMNDSKRNIITKKVIRE